MIANYGYEDGSGTYYIKIDTAKCAECTEKGCLHACPSELFQIEVDDWDEEVISIKQNLCNLIKTSCSSCKIDENTTFPCQSICSKNAITHSW